MSYILVRSKLTCRAGQVVGVFQHLVKLRQIPNEHVPMGLQNGERDKQNELIGVVFRPQYLSLSFCPL